MNKSDVLKTFNEHLLEMIASLIEIIDDNNDLKIAETAINATKKINPRIIITSWKHYVTDNYYDEILKGNIEHFLEKDYSNDVKNENNAAEILNKITVIKDNIKLLSSDNKNKTILYIQNLTKLCKLYHNN